MAFGRSAPGVSPYEATSLCQQWTPPEAPHCSNCLYAKVSGSPDEPEVRCAQGHGRPKSLWPLIRSKHAQQFVPAARCPDYEDMGRECNVYGRDGR